MTDAGRPVVVGVDGSAQSDRAVHWAAEAARVRNRPLHIVHAVPQPRLLRLGPAPAGLSDRTRGGADSILLSARRQALAHPDLRVSAEMIAGSPTAVLLAQTRRADMIVVGSRGRGGFTGLLLGSTASQLCSHANCDVVVIRGERFPARPADGVVVGVDGSAASAKAIRFAFEEASIKALPLTAVTAWSIFTDHWPQDSLLPPVEWDHYQQDAERVLAESLAGWEEKYPDVEVCRVVTEGPPGRVLVERTAGADLLVVGSRGRGGFAGLLLGSVSQAVLHHARCPVVVVPAASSQGE